MVTIRGNNLIHFPKQQNEIEKNNNFNYSSSPSSPSSSLLSSSPNSLLLFPSFDFIKFISELDKNQIQFLRLQNEIPFLDLCLFSIFYYF